MSQLKLELDLAKRQVDDLQVNLPVNQSDKPECEREAGEIEQNLEATIISVRAENRRLRQQVKQFRTQVVLLQHNSAPNNSIRDQPTPAEIEGNLVDRQNNNSISERHSENNNQSENDEIVRLRAELQKARDAVFAMKADRKRLRADKCSLLSQMRDVYSALESREAELRDLIQQYERAIRSGDARVSSLLSDQARWHQERSEMQMQLESERKLRCRETSEMRMKLEEMQARLYSLERRGLIGEGGDQIPESVRNGGIMNGHLPVNAAGSNGGLRQKILATGANGICQRTPSVGYDSMPMSPATPNDAMASNGAKANGNNAAPRNGVAKQVAPAKVTDVILARPDLCKVMTSSSDAPILVRMRDKTGHSARSQISGTSEDICGQNQRNSVQCMDTSNNSGGSVKDSSGSPKENNSARRLSRNRLSRLLNSLAGRSRNSSLESPLRNGKSGSANDTLQSTQTHPTLQMDADSLDRELAQLSLSSGEQNGEFDLDEKCALALSAARCTPMTQWNRAHVAGFAKLELGLDSAKWRQFCADCPSGSKLLHLANNVNNENLIAEFGLDTVLLRKKFKLVVEYYRMNDGRIEPSGKHTIPWTYVSENFLPALGMDQYSYAFAAQKVDGRLLNELSKKHFEKHLGVRDKFHLVSILKGVELLRMFQFDAEALEARRRECSRHNADLLVWTNERIQQWLHTIGMGAYASRIRQSGLHGALMVLDKSFNQSTLVTILRIQSGKRMAKKHLSASLAPLLADARVQLEHCPPGAKLEDDNHHVNDEAPLAHIAMMQSHGGDRKRRGRSQSPGTVAACSHSIDCDDTPKRRTNALRSSFGKLFSSKSGSQNQHTQDGNSEMNESCQSHQLQGHNLHDLPVAAHLTPNLATQNGGASSRDSGGRDLQKTPLSVINTWSSTTSDLGSSIERSHHMRAILGHTPQVLISSNNNPSTSQQQFLAQCQNGRAAESRKSPLQNGGTPMGVSAIKMRSRSAVFAAPHAGPGSNAFVARRHHININPRQSNQTQQNHRPHSVSDIAALAQCQMSGNVLTHAGASQNAEFMQIGGFDPEVQAYYEAVFGAQPHQSPCLSLDECSTSQQAPNGNPNTNPSKHQRRRIKGMSACAELLSSTNFQSTNYTNYYVNGSSVTHAVATPPRRPSEQAVFVNGSRVDVQLAAPPQSASHQQPPKIGKIDIKLEHEIGTISEQTEPDQESSCSLALNNQFVGGDLRFNERRPSSLAIERAAGAKRPKQRSQETDL